MSWLSSNDKGWTTIRAYSNSYAWFGLGSIARFLTYYRAPPTQRNMRRNQSVG